MLHIDSPLRRFLIVPPLFAFGITSETRLNTKMKEIAAENRHNNETVHWAEEQMKLKQLAPLQFNRRGSQIQSLRRGPRSKEPSYQSSQFGLLLAFKGKEPAQR